MGRREVTKTRQKVTTTSQFPGGWSHRRKHESGRVGEVLNMFDILPIHQNNPQNHNQS